MTATNVEVKRGQNETNAVLLRKFTKHMQTSGVLSHVRTLRFFKRGMSKLKKKSYALKRIAKQKEITRLKKLGKIQ